jgi:spermidine/putrescine transport system permease protein
MGRRGGPGLGVFSAAIYAFLYLPLLVLVLFSFNDSRLTAVWRGFTGEWYAQLFRNQILLDALRRSVLVAFVSAFLATVLGTAAAFGLARYRPRGQAVARGLFYLPIVIPEIVMASSLLIFFSAVGFELGVTTVVLSHVAFCLSYVVIVVESRLVGQGRQLEEAAQDLGATPWAAFWRVTFPLMLPAILSGALMAFTLSLDDFVITSFVAGVGANTLPLQIYSMLKQGLSPEINAASTVLLMASLVLVACSERLLRKGAGTRDLAVAAVVLLLVAAPLLSRPSGSAARTLNLYIWSNYIEPETLKKFEQAFDARVNLEVYDSNEAVLAKLQGGNVAYDVVVPSDYMVTILVKENLLAPLDPSRLTNFRNVDPRFLGIPGDPANRFSVPYVWGTTGIGFRRDKVKVPVTGWGALWEEAHRERILMLDDIRENFAAALRLMGQSINATDPRILEDARNLLARQKPLVRAYNSSNFEDLLLTGDAWLAQAYNGQIYRAHLENPAVDYVIPEEGCTLSVDSLVIPASAPHKELAHQFINWVLDAQVAAEICNTTLWSTANRAALEYLDPEVRASPILFPPPSALAHLEVMRDVGATTVLLSRYWTEIKSQ